MRFRLAIICAFTSCGFSAASAPTTGDEYLKAAHTAEICRDVQIDLVEELRLNDLIKQQAGEQTTVLTTAERLNTLRRSKSVSCDTQDTADALGFYDKNVAPYLSQPVFRTDRRI